MNYSKKFTLIELLMVIAIIGILMTILMPSLHKAREKARRAVCMSNMSQMGRAAFLYAKDNSGFTPDWPGKYYGIDYDTGSDNTGSPKVLRNLKVPWYGIGPIGMGKTISLGYVTQEAAGDIMFCPSRTPTDRYSNPGRGFTRWANWENGNTVEYSYQHRVARPLAKAEPNQLFGGDLAIWDNMSEDLMNVNCGGGSNFCHGDNYYNVNYFDMSVRGIYDSGKVLNVSQYYNRPDRAVQKLEELAQ